MRRHAPILLALLTLAHVAHAVTPFLGLEYGTHEYEQRNVTLLDAWARSLDGQTGAVFNVQAAAYGATCHATADQWTAIMRAIQAARNAGGGTVYFPACGQDLSYRIAQPIVLDSALYYLTFQGSPSAGASLLQPTTSFTGDALVHIGTTTLNERIAFHGMSFSGRMPGGTDLTVPLLWLQNVAQATVKDSYFLQSNATTGALSITGSSSQVIEVSSNVFGSTTQVGLYVDQTGDLRIVGNHFIEGRVGGGTSQRALHLNRTAVPGKLEIVGNEFSSWEGDWALDIGGVSGAANTATITGNTFADLKGGIRTAEAGVVVASNVFNTPRTSANAAISATNDGATITGNRIEWEDGVGIEVSGTNGTIVGNVLDGATTAIDCNGCTGVAIVGNRILDTGATTTHGIRERNGADSNLILGNEVTAGSSAKWTIIGAATQVWEPTTAEVASVHAGSFRGTPPTAETIVDTVTTITADACGGVKRITATGAVATNALAFTAPATANAGCVMQVCNSGTQTITLKDGASVALAGADGATAGDTALTGEDCVTVVSDGALWRQVGRVALN